MSRYAGVVLFAILALLTLTAQPLALATIRGYHHSLAPVAARIGLRCRFTPTCSRYAETVIARDGVMQGGWKAIRRVARCGPWTARGTSDPP